jgi:hypothetical protein
MFIVVFGYQILILNFRMMFERIHQENLCLMPNETLDHETNFVTHVIIEFSAKIDFIYLFL